MNQQETRCDWCGREATHHRAGERLCDQHTKEVDGCKDLAAQLRSYLEPLIAAWSLDKQREGYQSWQVYDAMLTMADELSGAGAMAMSKEVEV